MFLINEDREKILPKSLKTGSMNKAVGKKVTGTFAYCLLMIAYYLVTYQLNTSLNEVRQIGTSKHILR